MYVEREFNNIKEAADFITEHNITRENIIDITLHAIDNGITITFTTDIEPEV